MEEKQYLLQFANFAFLLRPVNKACSVGHARIWVPCFGMNI
jgi:hypothetical protein